MSAGGRAVARDCRTRRRRGKLGRRRHPRAACGSVQRTSTGLCWTGTGNAFTVANYVSVTGTTSWSRSFSGASFPATVPTTSPRVFTHIVGNQGSSATHTFTIDGVAPTMLSINRAGPSPTNATSVRADGYVQ